MQFQINISCFRSSHPKCSIKRAFLKNFAIFTGKHPCWSLFLIKLHAKRPVTLLKRGSNIGAFLWNLGNFCKQLFHRRSPVAASDVYAWNMLETQAYKPISMTDSSNLVETLQKECYYNKMINQNNKTLCIWDFNHWDYCLHYVVMSL